MNIEKRKQEIVAQMTSCTKDTYHKSEILPELIALQSELVELTFNKDHAELANLKLWDVEEHLNQLNTQYGEIASEPLQSFRGFSRTVCNLIKAEISGNRGEYKASKALEYLRLPHTVLRNIELCDGDERTEIDDIVITHGGITIVEVKNTSKDIMIDEAGHYYRTGEFLKYDCNIAEKLDVKERLLKKVLEASGIMGVRINTVLVFTNNRIEVQNKYARVKTCFTNTLNYVIESFENASVYSDSDIERIQSAISSASASNLFPLEFDVQALKEAFATVLATLESVSCEEQILEESLDEPSIPVIDKIDEATLEAETESEKDEKVTDPKSVPNFFAIFVPKALKALGKGAAVVAVTIVSTLFANKIMLSGGAK